MSKVISNENGIKIELSGTEEYRISFTSKYNDNSNIREIIKQHKLYELLYNLNKDIIEKYEFNFSNGIDKINYVLNFGTTMGNFFEKKNSMKYILNLANKLTIINNDKFKITGNCLSNDNADILNVRNLTINIEIINNNMIQLNLSYLFYDTKLQINALLAVLSKIMLRFKTYLQ